MNPRDSPDIGYRKTANIKTYSLSETFCGESICRGQHLHWRANGSKSALHRATKNLGFGTVASIFPSEALHPPAGPWEEINQGKVNASTFQRAAGPTLITQQAPRTSSWNTASTGPAAAIPFSLCELHKPLQLSQGTSEPHP